MRDEWLFPNRATPAGSSAYYSIRLSPAPLRNDLAVILAWQQEVASVLTDVSDPGVARLKLQWWREELGRTYAGAARHPLCQALAAANAAHALPEADFESIIDTLETRVAAVPIADLNTLRRTLGREMGAGFELLSRCCGITSETALAHARSAGIACGLVYLIRDLGANLRRGRADVPADLLQEQGLTRKDLTERVSRERMVSVLSTLAEEARTRGPGTTDRTLGSLPPVVVIRYRILQALLKEIQATGFDVLNQRIGLTPLRKLWIAWQAHRER